MVDTRDDFYMQSMKIDPAIKKIYEKYLKIRRKCISQKVEEYDDDMFYDYNYFWNKQCISCDQFGLQQVEIFIWYQLSPIYVYYGVTKGIHTYYENLINCWILFSQRYIIWFEININLTHHKKINFNYHFVKIIINLTNSYNTF